MKQLLIILSFVMPLLSQAQVKKWTMQECMLYAVQKNHKVNKQLAQNSIYHQQYLEAIGKLLPSVDAGIGAGFNFGSNRDFSTQKNVSVNSFSNSYDLSGSLTLFDGLANINTLKMQRINRVKGKYELQNNKDQVAYDTMGAFLNVLYYQGTVELGEEQLAESGKALKQMERMEELGLKSFPDVAEARAKEAEDAYNLTRQKNILKIGIIILKEKMNFPIDEDLDVVDYTNNSLVAKTIDSPMDIYVLATNQLPEAVVAKEQAEASKYSYRAAKGNLSPRLSVNGGVSSNFFRYMNGGEYEPFKDQLKNNRGEYVSFTLRVPLFSGFSRSSSVKKSKANMVIAQCDKDETLRKVYSDIEQAVADMNGQVDEFTQANKQVDAMREAHKVNQRKYEEGLVDAIQVSTSSNRLLRARVEELNSKYKYFLKAKLVDYYKGIPYITE